MPNVLRVPFTAMGVATGEASLLPLLPLTLSGQGKTQETHGLLDTGATVNVLPFSLGEALGAVWNERAANLHLSGNLAQYPARPLVLLAAVGQFAPVRLAFAWTQAENVPLLLGQVNFFMEYDVCFYRARHVFEVQPKKLLSDNA